MAIEFFRQDGKGLVPRASIRKEGQIGLNRGAVKKYELSRWKGALLGYDREERVVAIQREDDLTVPGAKRFIVRDENATVSAKAFLEFFGIPYKDKTRRFELEFDDGSQCLLLRLETPSEKAPEMTALA